MQPRRNYMSYFSDNQYLTRKKILKLVGGAFHVYNHNQDVVGYSKMKAFKLKEDIVMYTDENMTEKIFSIKARNIIDFAAIYDVYDKNEQKLGAMKRQGLKSMIKDEWLIFDESDSEIGIISEDSILGALFRRFITNLLPQNYSCKISGNDVCEYRQNINPLVTKITTQFSNNDNKYNDLLMAGSVLLCAIEGKQN